MAHPLTVLIIDDSPEDHEVYRRYVMQDQEYNYTILESETGDNALELYRQFSIDCILLDFVLPDMDGLEFLAELQKLAQPVMPAVVMLTAYGNEAIAVQAVKSGVHDYLVKGQTTAERLHSTIHSAVAQAKLRKELQQSEARLRETQQFIERIAETIPGILYVYDVVERRNVYMNGQVHSLLGYSPQQTQELGVQFLNKLMHPEDLPLFYAYMQELASIQDGEIRGFEYRMQHASGEWRWFYSRDTVFTRNNHGLPSQIVGTSYDITTRKHTEEQLRLSNERFQQAAAAVNCLIYDWDVTTDFVERTEGLTRILGYSLQEAEPSSQWWSEKIHPQDQEHLTNYFQMISPEDNYYAVEYRIRHKNNEYRYVLDQGVITRDRNGSIIRAVGSTTDISERKHQEATLRASEAKFRRIIESNIIGIYFGDSSGCIYEANDAFLEMLDYTRADLAAGTLRWDVITPPEYQSLDQQKIQQLQTSGACTPFEKEYLRKDGTRIPILLAIVRIDDTDQQVYSACFVLDLTQRKLAEAALRESEERYRYLSDAMPQLVWISNAQGECEHINRRWYEFSGQTLAEAQQLGWRNALHPDDIQPYIQKWRASLQTGEPYEQELRYRKRDGSYRWHLARALPIRDEQGNIVRWYGTSTDIDDRKQLETERQQLLQLEQVARAEAEAANRTKDEFVTMVSHDLRSPLNAILGWTQLLRMREFDKEGFLRALDTIERSAQSQAKLLEDLLNMSRILQGKLNLELRQVNLAVLVGAAIEVAYPEANAKNIHLGSAIDQSIPLITGDSDRLLQILANLLSNAIKFTPAGGQIEVKLLRHDNDVEITVSDTGIGISPEFLPYVFERYRQDNRNTKKGGLGLGLAIARHLVELHGGTIQAASCGEGQGATFTIKLPLLPISPDNSIKQ
ncbi:PAS domain-containing protein [Nostoc sp. FACHB-152]|uniref:hybrid sensor histidine kinase/response regulator n=1 Tax=unclassified Nostoc TaxID=2593658 RepID=UPI0016841486|nr:MULTISPECIES: PAS domain-containing protein [unclassified Nostoc]MBD2448917.1 PAS domain-containing protein [Nostoc sp. FACHB-152]MBD2471171.1 PAS domain-containing protein [Nostoc sp. FACHB-145]